MKTSQSLQPALLILAAFCFHFSLGQQQDHTKNIDSIIAINASKKDQVITLVQEAAKMRYTPDAKHYIERALAIAKKENNPLLFANSYYSLGNFYFYASQIDSSLAALDLADENLKKTPDALLQASVLSTRGGIYNRTGDVLLAITTNLEAQAILDAIDTTTIASPQEMTQFRGKQLVLSNSLANLYLKTEDNDKALEFYKEAFDIAMQMNTPANASVVLSNQGELLSRMGNYQEALETSIEARDMKVKYQLPQRFVITSNINIASILGKMGDKQESKQYLNEALEASRANNYSNGIMLALWLRGDLNYELGNLEQALDDAKNALALAKKNQDTETIMNASNTLYKVERDLGNNGSSLENYERYVQLKDSFFNEKNVRKMTRLAMQYDFDKREAEQKIAIEEQQKQKKIWIAGAIFLGLFAFTLLLFFLKRLKYQKTIAQQKDEIRQQEITELSQKNKLSTMNSMIEGQEKERSRIAKDLHDGLGSLLSSVKSHFEAVVKSDSTAETPLEKTTKELIDRACEDVRRISHNMMPHALAISGLEEGIRDIAERLKLEGYDVSLEFQHFPKLSQTHEVFVYRLVQEVIANIKKHAEARSIFIQLMGHDNTAYIIIEDDGKGFNYDEAISKSGLGLENINSRVTFLEGDINWDTNPGQGTTINITFPTTKKPA